MQPRQGSLLITLACLLPPAAGSLSLAVAEAPARVAAIVAWSPEQAPAEAPAAALAETAAAVLHADYRGDRAELARRATALDSPTTSALEPYRLYWRGFALWRRALNGFNETPTPSDLRADLDRAVAAFRAALARNPEFEDAQSALAGCLMSEMFLAGSAPAEEKDRIFSEGIAALRAVKERAAENPRSLWILGGSVMGAPPPWGGDMAKAAALYERALSAARREAADPSRPAWAPRWGAAESLMSLAYMHSHGANPNRALARAYASGALASAPDWHYVADILLPAIEALPAPESPIGTAAGNQTRCTPP